ncbi:hypothetical protein BY996DRAFT_6623758 [Phakopsora pachyrhizi]|nr:hypothetical protein BY996DRAFT_6623758 [Phakopsora pachyrhizi]
MSLKQSGFQVLQALQLSYWENKLPKMDIDKGPKGGVMKGLTKKKLGKEGKEEGKNGGIARQYLKRLRVKAEGLIVIPYGAPIALGNPKEDSRLLSMGTGEGFSLTKPNREHQVWGSVSKKGTGDPVPTPPTLWLTTPDIGHPETVYTHSVAHSSSSWQTPASPQQNTWTNAPAPPTTQSPETGPSV